MNEILYAVNLGYKIDENGIVYKPNGEVQKTRKTSKKNPYLIFSLRLKEKVMNIPVHRLQAYFSYGESMFKKGIVVRHLDDIPTNNKKNNIAIGSHSENSMDIPDHIRKSTSKKASDAARLVNKKYDYKSIKKDRSKGMSYKQLMEKYGISSKGTLNHIINSKA